MSKIVSCNLSSHAFDQLQSNILQLGPAHGQTKPKIPITNEPQHDKTNNMTCVPREDSVQPGHPPWLLSVFTVRFMDS